MSIRQSPWTDLIPILPVFPRHSAVWHGIGEYPSPPPCLSLQGSLIYFNVQPIMAYCARCDRSFPHDRALAQHRHNSKSHIICYSCDRDFDTVEARNQHYRDSSKHHYCFKCEEDFDDGQELRDHQQRVHNGCPRCGKVGCYECGLKVIIHPPLQFFDSSWELRNHRTNDHFYCEPCDRFFRTLDNLKAHQRSSIHKARDHHCPHVGCNKAFLDNADLVAHWETGTCPSGVDRHRIDEAFVAVDSRYFTDPAVLVADSYGNRRAPPPSKARVRDSMRDGDAWKCSRCSRTFGTRDILRQHLRGPAHAPRFYRCAEAYNGCDSYFSVLSALVRHTESECCSLRSILLRLQLDIMRRNIF